MGDNEYKISLGVDVDVSDIQSQINTKTKDKTIPIKVEIENLKDIKEQLQNLTKSKGNKSLLSFDTTSLENSLKDVSNTIKDIKASIGSLDSGAGMKSLLSSINQISLALDKASSKFEELSADLKTLSNKDFNINLGINMGGSNPVSRNAAYGNKVRNETLPQLKQQADALENYLKEYYKVADGFNATQKLLQGTNAGKGKANLYDLLPKMLDTTGSLSSQMTAFKEYIALIKEAANIKGVNLSGVTSQFSIQADDLVKDAQDIQSGAKEAKDGLEQLKQVFGGSGIDANALSVQLDSIVADLGEIKTIIQGLSSGISIDGLTQSFDRLSESIELLAKNCTTAQHTISETVGGLSGSTGGADNGIKNIGDDLKQVTVTADNTADAIDSIKNAMSSMKFNDSSIDAITKDLEAMNIVIERVAAKEKNGTLQVTVKGINEAKEAVTVVKQLDDATNNFSVVSTTISKPFEKGAEAAKEFKRQTDAVEKIKINFETDSYYNQLSQMEANFDQLSGASKELQESVKQVNTAYRNLEFAMDGTEDEFADKERLIQAEKAYAEALKKTTNLIKIQARAEKEENDALKLQDNREVFQSKIDAWLTKNSAATKQFGGRLLELKARAENADQVTLNHLNKELQKVDRQAEKAGLKMQSLGDKIKSKAKEYMAYFSVAEVFMEVTQAMKAMFNTVKEIDTAMTGLYRVTDLSAAEYNTLFDNMIDSAKNYGATLKDIINATTDWVRAGFDADTSLGLAEVTTMYQHISDLDYDTAAENLITAYNGFKDELNGAFNGDTVASVNYIADIFNELDNNFAVTSAGLGEALTRSASALDLAGNSIQETAGMVTGIVEVTQDPEKAGSALKVLSLRLRGMKGQLEELGEETDENVENISKMQGQILNMTKGKVNIFDASGNFKSTYEIMQGIAEVWGELNSIDQANLLETIAGKNRANDVAALLSNWENVEAAVKSASEAEGSAARENAKYIDSIQGRLDKLTTAYQSFANTFMNSDLLKGGISFITSIVEGLDVFIDKVGALPALLGTIAAGMSAFKNKGLFNFDKDNTSIKLLGTQLNGLKGKYTQIHSAIDRYNSLSSKSASFQEKYNKSLANSSTSIGRYLSGLKGAKATFGGYIGSLVGATLKTIALEAATIALNAAITMGISFAIQGAIKLFDKMIVTSSELAEKVDELIESYRQGHEELRKLKGDYDTSNESSMISKYERLSKGVDNLGRNVSLTADEYSEYQNIINTIADQIPSLVSGYDSQGNALLSCKGNVEELTEAYEKLIHAQNQEILTNSGDIEKNFSNVLKDASGDGWWSNGHGFWAGLLESFGFNGAFIGLADLELKNDTVKNLKKLLDPKNDKKAILKKLRSDRYSSEEIRDALNSANIDVSWWQDPLTVLEDTLETDPQKVKNIVDNYYEQFADEVEQQKTIAQVKLSEAFDVSSAISGLNYGNISEDLQAVAYQVVSSLDLDFFEQLKEKDISVETWTSNMLDQLNNIGKENNTKIESAFDLQTKFNGGEISYGEYVKGLEDVGSLIEKLNLDSEVEEQLKISLGLDEGGLVEGYHKLKNRLANSEEFNMMPSEYDSFIKGLSSNEVSILWSVIPELEKSDYKETIDDLKASLEKEMMLQGLTLDLDLEVEATGIEALNTALAESVTGTGLSAESISALKARYADLEAQGYDVSAMFENTSHGIHLNREEFNKLENELSSQKIAEVDSDLKKMKDTYDELGEQIRACDDPVRKSELFSERQLLGQRIAEAAELATQYKGLTSAYNDWLAAEEAGSERDMYENMIEGFETVGDEISRGWLDDGTIKFLELIRGEKATIIDGNGVKKEINIATASAQDLKQVWKDLDKTIEHTSYSVKDFFTVDKDGNSTSQGVYNFLDAIGQMEEEAFGGKDVVQRKDGKIIGFDFQIAGGDKAIADALGISEELVQIMKRAAEDAGFVVSLDGTYKEYAILESEARAAANTLKELSKENEKLKKAGGDFEFDFDSTSVKSLEEDIKQANNILDTFKDKDGNIDLKAEGAIEAMQIVSTLQARLDDLKSEQYGIGLTVEDEEFEEPLENLQEYGRTVSTLNQLKINPNVNSEEIEQLESELEEISKYFANLDGKTKVKLGFEADDNWEEVQKKIESGEVKIPTTLDIQTNMDKNLEDLKKIALLGSGLLSDEQEEKLKLEILADVEVKAGEVDDSDVEDKVNDVVNGETSSVHTSSSGKTHGGGGKSFEVEAEVDLIVEQTDDLELAELVKDYDPIKQKVIVEYFAEHSEVDRYTPEQKEALVEFIADSESLDSYTPEQKQAIVEYLTDSADPDSWTPEQKEAVAKFIKDTADVDTWSPEKKEAIAKFIRDSIDVDTYAPPNPNGTVTFLRNSSDVDTYDPPSFTRYVTYYAKKAFTTGAKAGEKALENRFGIVNGTANSDGSAFRQGDWRTKRSETALTGELGREIVVTPQNRWYTVGDNGAEFVNIPRGSIVFNHKQTEELLRNGKATSDGGRARALVNGTAFLGGTAHRGEANDGMLLPEDGDDSSKSKFEDTIDWIETILKRAERAIDKYEQQADNVYKTWSKRNQALANEIAEVDSTISLYEQAKNKYLSEANKVGLDKYYNDNGIDYATLVRNGSISVEDFEGESDEKLVEKIKNYQDLYDKYLDCVDKIDELKEKEASLYSQRFDNLSEEYENLLQGFEHTETMLNEYISQSEEKGYIVSKNYYSALIGNEEDRINTLKQERSALIKARDEAVANNEFDKNSEEWYNMCAEIDSVTQAIEEGTTSIIEYNNAIRDIDWQVFDLIQERISDITAESEFLVELMSNKDLFNDNGKLTEQGTATLGLHGQNYNTYMYQADDYGAKVAEIDSKIASGEYDPYDGNVLAKRKEYLEAQREAILNAESEKNAIKDLVEEGINLELDALQDRIDLHNEELDSMKDLYDYQKNVEEQTKNIASLRKQLGAYEGFDDEEARAKVQELKVSLKEAEADLKETEWDRYIDQQEQLLTTLYDEYELILNTRLDNVDLLVQGVINEVNASANTIKTTLETEVGNVGTTLSAAMNDIWNAEGVGNKVITKYGDAFQAQQTNTNIALGNIKSDVDAMAKKLGAKAEEKVQENQTQSSTNADPTKGSNNGNNGNKQNNASDNQRTDKEYYGVALAVWNGNYGWGNGDTRKKRLKEKGFDASKVQSIVNKMGKEGYVHTAAWIKRYYGITDKDLKKYGFSSYATGKQNFLDDEIAWTQENGQEFIVRPSDGAILTPLAKGDSVLDAQASNNIWNMANSPVDFIKDNLNLGIANIPNNSNVHNNYSQNFESVVFSMPNIQNYNELLSAMQKDKNFEKLILSMSIDRLAGGSSLAKGKVIR